MTIIEINGEKFKRVPEQEAGKCTGCVRKSLSFDDCRSIADVCIDTQTILKHVRPKARRTDPDTSHAAAAAVTPKRASIKDHILTEIAVHGGCTGTEIADRTRLRLNSITPRFKELSDAGLIKDSGQRRERQIVWVLA